MLCSIACCPSHADNLSALERCLKQCLVQVLLNGRGNMIVRPTHLELSLLQNPFQKSIAHHMLASYHCALLSVRFVPGAQLPTCSQLCWMNVQFRMDTCFT